MKLINTVLVAGFVSLGLVGSSFAAVDEAAAQALAKGSKCLTCHSVDKEKKGPSFKKIAAEQKGKADAEAKITKQITAGPKFKDGSGDHPMIDSKDANAIKNLVSWILSR